MRKSIFVLLVSMACAAGLMAQKYEPKLQLKPGQTFTSVENQHITQTVIMGGNEMKTVQLIRSFSTRKVLEQKGENVVVESVVDSITVSVESPQGKMSFSSNDKDVPKEFQEMTKLVGRKFVLELTPKHQLVGEVTAADGEEIPKALQATLQSGTMQAAALYSVGAMKEGQTVTCDPEMMKHVVGELATHAQGAKVKATVTLVRVTPTELQFNTKIDFSGTVEGMPLEGPTTLSYGINKETGMIVNMLSTSALKGSMNTPQGSVSVSINAIGSSDAALVQ